MLYLLHWPKAVRLSSCRSVSMLYPSGYLVTMRKKIAGPCAAGTGYTYFSGKFILCLAHNNFLDAVVRFDLVDHVQAFYHFTKNGVVTIQVRCVVAAVANKEL